MINGIAWSSQAKHKCITCKWFKESWCTKCRKFPINVTDKECMATHPILKENIWTINHVIALNNYKYDNGMSLDQLRKKLIMGQTDLSNILKGNKEPGEKQKKKINKIIAKELKEQMLKQKKILKKGA